MSGMRVDLVDEIVDELSNIKFEMIEVLDTSVLDEKPVSTSVIVG